MVTIEIIKDAKSADLKSTTSNRSLHLAVNINIAAFTTKAKRPRDNKIAGSVNNLTNEPITPFIRPNKKVTQRYVLAPPIMVIPEIKDVAAQKAKVLLTKLRSNLTY